MNYLIIGDDTYLREHEERKIKEKFLPEDASGMNYAMYRGGDSEGLLDSLTTVPFLSESRVVLIKDPEKLADRTFESLLAYLDNPAETSILVISAPASFKKNKYCKKMISKMKTVKADIPEKDTVKKWIRGFLQRENIDISSAAVDLIVELKGQDLSGIKAELEKLADFSGGKSIEVSDVEELVGRSVTETVFKLVDAIDAGNGEWAFRILGDLYADKKQPPEIIGYLGWHMRMMQGIKRLLMEGATAGEMASELGYSPGYMKRLSYQAKKYSPERIARRVSLLLDTDKDIKTGRKEAKLALEMLISGFLR